MPDGFEADARILQPLGDGRRWSETAPAYLADGVEPYPYPFPGPVEDVEGDIGTKLVDVLLAALGQATTTPEHCHFGLWTGWGEFHEGSYTSVFRQHVRLWAPIERVRARRQYRKAKEVEAH